MRTNSRMNCTRAAGIAGVAGMIAAIGAASDVRADDDERDGSRLEVRPWVFVHRGGETGQCATSPYPAGSNSVTSAWLRGLGLPDNGGAMVNATDLRDNPNKRDPHTGLLLNKNSPTAECSSAGAEVHGVRGMLVTASSEVGFDYRVGTHCSGGAPRFNVSYIDPAGNRQFAFREPCSLGIQTPAPQYPVEWMRTRLLLAPLIPAGSRIRRIDIVFDEGPEIIGSSDPTGVGLATIDNIYVNGRYARAGSGIAEPGRSGERDDRDDD